MWEVQLLRGGLCIFEIIYNSAVDIKMCVCVSYSQYTVGFTLQGFEGLHELSWSGKSKGTETSSSVFSECHCIPQSLEQTLEGSGVSEVVQCALCRAVRYRLELCEESVCVCVCVSVCVCVCMGTKGPAVVQRTPLPVWICKVASSNPLTSFLDVGLVLHFLGSCFE